jgi:hypothetical protein
VAQIVKTKIALSAPLISEENLGYFSRHFLDPSFSVATRIAAH